MTLIQPDLLDRKELHIVKEDNLYERFPELQDPEPSVIMTPGRFFDQLEALVQRIIRAELEQFSTLLDNKTSPKTTTKRGYKLKNRRKPALTKVLSAQTGWRRKLIDRRIADGLYQPELSIQLGLPPTVIGNLETGWASGRLDYLIAISKYLGIPLEEMV